MKTIWKFPLKITDRQTIKIPSGYSILHVEGNVPQEGVIEEPPAQLWAAVDPSHSNQDVEIIIVGTGHPLPHVGDFIGTIIDGYYIWHVFTGPGHSSNKVGGFHYQTKDN